MEHLPAGLNLRQRPLRILNRHGLPDWKSLFLLQLNPKFSHFL